MNPQQNYKSFISIWFPETAIGPKSVGFLVRLLGNHISNFFFLCFGSTFYQGHVDSLYQLEIRNAYLIIYVDSLHV